MRILVVEDDRLISRAMADSLGQTGHAVDVVDSGSEALEAAFAAPYDCILLDLGLPGLDGVAVLNAWRRRRLAVPVIIVTARDALDDRVQGLDRGADDYLVKPFEMSELMARIRAVTRRGSGTASDGLMSNGVVTLNPATHEVSVNRPDGSVSEVILTPREFALLEALMTRPGAVLSREALEQRIYSWDDEIESNAVEYIIHTLRRKIGSEVIRNVRGVGWKVARPG